MNNSETRLFLRGNGWRGTTTGDPGKIFSMVKPIEIPRFSLFFSYQDYYYNFAGSHLFLRINQVKKIEYHGSSFIECLMQIKRKILSLDSDNITPVVSEIDSIIDSYTLFSVHEG